MSLTTSSEHEKDLRSLPSTHEALANEKLRELRSTLGDLLVKNFVREELALARSEALQGRGTNPTAWDIADKVLRKVSQAAADNLEYKEVFNLTGVLLHSNLGRATIHERVFERAKASATSSIALEFDLTTGSRGKREAVVKKRLCALLECESATFVNNNAAALVIVANTLARSGETVVSRSELVEIGGSFRLPDMLSASGTQLVEVGTTNRTYLKDYEDVINEHSSLLLKVHPSNYQIQGFTNEVSAKDLAELGRKYNIPVVIDLGSGALIDLERFGLPHEPKPQEPLKDGVSLVTFSGDKLLGGPQAGIIVGDTALIDQIDKNPLKRAFRLDKVALSLLNETLRIYESPDAIPKSVDIYRKLTTGKKQLLHRARSTHAILEAKLRRFDVSIEETVARLGSGSLPSAEMPSISVGIRSTSGSEISHLQRQLMALSKPVLGHIKSQTLWLDMLGAEPLSELETVLQELPSAS